MHLSLFSYLYLENQASTWLAREEHARHVVEDLSALVAQQIALANKSNVRRTRVSACCVG